MYQTNASGVFGALKSKADFDRERANFLMAKKAQKRQDMMGDIDLAKAQASLNNPNLSEEQLVAKAVQLGGVQALSPQEQAQLQALDIMRTTEVGYDPYSGTTYQKKQSVLDKLGQRPTDVIYKEPKEVMNQEIMPKELNMEQAVNALQSLQAAKQPLESVPTQLTKEIDMTGLSPRGKQELLIEQKKLEMKANQESKGADSRLRSLAYATSDINKAIDNATKLVNPYTTGVIGGRGFNPLQGREDLSAALDTIEADAAFSTLQEMRDNSPTGGALGAISERELGLLGAAKDSLKQTQSQESLLDALENYRNIRNRMLEVVKEAYIKDYGSLPQGFDELFNKQLDDPLGILQQ